MSSQRGVHNRIHTLRGEQFRHLQNLRGSRSHLSSNNIHTVPSLPLRLLSLADPSLDLTTRGFDSPPPKSNSNDNTGESPLDGTSSRSPAGPSPPKSWMLNSKKDIRETAGWRTEALSLVFNELAGSQTSSASSNYSTTHTDELPASLRGQIFHRPRVTSLSLLCLQVFLTTCDTSEFRDEVVPCIPPHLRKDLMRFTAIHSPLPSSRLYPLLEPTGHADGEIIIVGPGTTLKEDYFMRSHLRDELDVSPHRDGDFGTGEPEKDWDWDTDDTDANVPLSTLILLNTSVPSSTLFSFPPTLTHLVLINLSTPIPLHRVPTICPLVVVFDVSFNSWLGAVFAHGESLKPQQPRDPIIGTIVDLDRIDWARWSHLRVLGFRGNYVPEGFVKKVNEGRWEDITVVL